MDHRDPLLHDIKENIAYVDWKPHVRLESPKGLKGHMLYDHVYASQLRTRIML
jgi:hypothetical protein